MAFNVEYNFSPQCQIVEKAVKLQTVYSNPVEFSRHSRSGLSLPACVRTLRFHDDFSSKYNQGQPCLVFRIELAWAAPPRALNTSNMICLKMNGGDIFSGGNAFEKSCGRARHISATGHSIATISLLWQQHHVPRSLTSVKKRRWSKTVTYGNNEVWIFKCFLYLKNTNLNILMV